jgi:hypothetical protein
MLVHKLQQAATALPLSFERRWGQWFNLHEIENSSALQWAFGAILFFFFLTFNRWIAVSITTIDAAQRGYGVCWPYFQDCTWLYFLQALPLGYSQTAFYMALYAVMLGVVFYMWRGQWARAHMLMTLLFAWKAFVMFVLSYVIAGPYDYFHIIFAFVLLFLPFKEYFLKLTIVVLYFLSGLVKLDGTWILGTYFTTMQEGLPLLPTALTPLFTNLVVFSQVAGAWFLLSSRPWLRNAALAFFILFHLYSGILVYYHYPSVSLPLLIILFGMYARYQRPPWNSRAAAGWIFVIALFLFHIPPYFIEGDRRLTLEGNRYGMFMFEANHQCVAEVSAHLKPDGDFVEPLSGTTTALECGGQTCLVSREVYEQDGLVVRKERFETGASWNRCDPYEYFRRAKQRCALSPAVEKIGLVFDHSINGGPFYRIVNEENLCDLEYMPFSHNEWIKLPPEAPPVGLPVKDAYRY